MNELNALDSTVESIIVDGCNNESFTVLNLTRFVNLKVFEVGNYSFIFVSEVYLIGLSKLERVVIGMNSLNRMTYDLSTRSNGHFHLKNCYRLRELRIGRNSFTNYHECDIEGYALEMLEIGDLGEGTSFRTPTIADCDGSYLILWSILWTIYQYHIRTCLAILVEKNEFKHRHGIPWIFICLLMEFHGIPASGDL